MNWKTSKIEQLLVHVLLFPVLLRHNFSHQRFLLSTFLRLRIDWCVSHHPHTFSSSRKALERFSRRKRALTFTTSLSRAWILLFAVLSVFGLLPNCVTSHSQFSMRRPKPCLCRWIVSSCCWCCASRFVELTNVTVASTVMGEWSNIKHKTNHVDANLQMNFKRITLNQMANRHTTHPNDLLSREKNTSKKCWITRKRIARRTAHLTLQHVIQHKTLRAWLGMGTTWWRYIKFTRRSPEIIANYNGDAIGFRHIRNPALFLKWVTPLRPTNCHLASPWRKATPNTAPETQHKKDNIPKKHKHKIQRINTNSHKTHNKRRLKSSGANGGITCHHGPRVFQSTFLVRFVVICVFCCILCFLRNVCFLGMLSFLCCCMFACVLSKAVLGVAFLHGEARVTICWTQGVTHFNKRAGLRMCLKPIASLW